MLPLSGTHYVEAKDTRSLWQRIFRPAKPIPQKKHKVTHHKKSNPSPTPTKTPPAIPTDKRSPSGDFIVDNQWYANYLEQEVAWSYYLSYDKDIKFVDGSFHVPPVVYRHSQDMAMAGAPKR